MSSSSASSNLIPQGHPAGDAPSDNTRGGMGSEELRQSDDSQGIVADDTSRSDSLQPSGTVLGDYVILSKIGSGGCGTVYKARHQRMERIVALKMLNSTMDEFAIKRFHREVKSAAKLTHPHIVTAFDAGEYHGTPYLVLEFVEGQSLKEVIAEHRQLQVDLACDFVIQAARGLAYAHRRKIIHRDIKPSNLMFDSEGLVKILDMGLARTVATSSDSKEGRPGSTDGITSAGLIVGTVAFMSPEQGEDAKSVDQRSDIYSLGCTFYYLLTGRSVFHGETLEVLLAHANAPRPSLRDARPDVPETLDALFQRMVAKDPNDRFQTMNEVIAELEEFIDPGSMTNEPVEAAPLSRFESMIQDAEAPSSVSELEVATAVGIDFGTMWSSIAHVDKDTGPAILQNSDGESKTPSLVMIDGSSISIGKKAFERVGEKSDGIAEQIKRDLGQEQYHEPLSDQQYPPEALVAVILNKLVTDAKSKIGEFQHVVISVPAFFDDARRKAIQDAARIAGLELLDLINEPTAIAVAYCHENGLLDSGAQTQPQLFFVGDFGDGAFDVSLIEFRDNKLSVLATDGAPILGGRDWDERLAGDVSRLFKQKYEIDPLEDRNSRGLLLRECQSRRHELSENQQVTIQFEFQGKPANIKISREQLEHFTGDMKQVMIDTINRALNVAKIGWPDVDRVFLSGGLSRMPMIRQMVVSLSGKEPEMWLSEEDAVAYGAALFAGAKLAKRRGEQPRFQIAEVNSHSMGVIVTHPDSGEKINSVLIPRNTRLPASAKRTFKTSMKGQHSLKVNIVQGEAKSLSKCTLLGRCVIDGLSPDLPAHSPVTVEFRCQANGRLTVYLEQPDTGHRVSQEVGRTNQLSQDDIDHWHQWLESATLYADLL